MEKYLKEFHYDDITNLLNENNERLDISIYLDLSHLQQKNFNLFNDILDNATAEYVKWDSALLNVQKFIAEEKDAFLDADYRIKVNCHVRFIRLPPGDPRYKPIFPNNDQVSNFVQVKGNVVRMSQARLLEYKREYICSRCENSVVLEAQYTNMYVFEAPRHCANSACKGQMHQKYAQPQPKFCKDYQEIKIQELLSDKNIPPSLIVTLENDLVDTCQPGDCVVICGTVERRWRPIHPNSRLDAFITMRAISASRDQKKTQMEGKNLPEQLLLMQTEWFELLQSEGEDKIRDLMLRSICPEVYGLYPIKLAIALVVCSGGIDNTISMGYGTNKRGQSHLLLVGDPGMAKSRLLLSATAIAPRAVHTTGMGCSSAGLTAAAVKEGNEWQLEAGALVLADGGICCIDEFNLMRETDRSSIHEAMEQQTISMAKAGLVCKLSTRCAIIAAANPKNLYSMSEPEGTSSLNIGIASPLLSRFDLVYILRDERTEEWDIMVCDHLLGASVADSSSIPDIGNVDKETLWSTERLQSHFSAVRNIQPRVSDEANALLTAYYKACRYDHDRDPARTTVRLFDSLFRLTQANARLVFREVANVRDAVMVIRLMESTYGFGRILKPFDVVREDLPLSPSEENIEEIFKVLGLERRSTEVVNEKLDNIISTQIPTVSPHSSQPVIALKPASPLSSQLGNEPKLVFPNDVDKPVQKPRRFGNALTNKELDEILALDDEDFPSITKRDVPKVIFLPGNDKKPPPKIEEQVIQSRKRKSTDVIDEILSGIDENDVRRNEKVESLNRGKLNLGQFRNKLKLCIPKPVKNEQINLPTTSKVLTDIKSVDLFAPDPSQPKEVQTHNKTTTIYRNRMFHTQSDDSDNEMEEPGPNAVQVKTSPIPAQVPEKTDNKFQCPEAVTKETNVVKVPAKPNNDDSAYDSIRLSSHVNGTQLGKNSQQNIQQPLTGRRQRKYEDLSCLDNLDDL